MLNQTILQDNYINNSILDTKIESGLVRIEPKEDMLIMFPAHLPHRVNQNLSEKDRISIAFNFSIEQVDNDK